MVEEGIRLYGETKRQSQAGYMLPDGRLLDLLRSEARHILHVSVARRLLSQPEAANDDVLVCEFLRRTGWVRLDLNKGYVHMVSEPTPFQLQKLFGLLKYRAEPLTMYVTDGMGRVKHEQACFPRPIHELRALVEQALAAQAASGMVLAVSPFDEPALAAG